MRSFPAVACLVVGWLQACCSTAVSAPAAPRPSVELRGTLALPDDAPDGDGNRVRLTGISGIAWLAADRYVAVLDNSDRLLFFTLDLSRTGEPLAARDLRVVRLAAVHDFEDVAVCPAPLRDRIAARAMRRDGDDPGDCLLLAEEDTPAVRAVAQRGGDLLGVVPLPEVMRGRRPNRGLESLAVDPDDGSIWTANEEALTGDGPAACIDAGTVVRLVRIPLPADPPLPTRQYAYAVDAPHGFVRVFGGEPLSGVVAVAALGAGRLLVLERAAGPGVPPFVNRLYLVETAQAADVAHVERDLAARADLRLRKQLLWEDALGCNLEGLCLGPPLAGGGRALLGVADNGGLGTPNQLVGLALMPPPQRRAAIVIGGGIVLLVLVVVVLAALPLRRRGGRLTSP